MDIFEKIEEHFLVKFSRRLRDIFEGNILGKLGEIFREY